VEKKNLLGAIVMATENIIVSGLNLNVPAKEGKKN
jgi:hypothetical protein